jgi:S-adenosyl-L-methionine hydrolase (adenosine-forming)
MGVRKSISNNQQPPIIALLTDFGLQDQYAAAMKAVILSLNPVVRIVDFSHDVQPHKISQAGYLLWSAYKYFPQKTIFVCVVDPGVGSERKIIAAQTSHHTFLAPDNGLLDAVLSEEQKFELVEMSMEKIERIIAADVAATFHGRDLFAPIAAHLSKGIAVRELGVVRENPFVHAPFVHGVEDVTKAAVLHVDRFGNIITNIRVGDLVNAEKKIKAVAVGSNLISRWVRTYSDAPENTPCLLIGSSGLVEISVKLKSAAVLLAAMVGAPIRVYWQ